jgi:histidine kinase
MRGVGDRKKMSTEKELIAHVTFEQLQTLHEVSRKINSQLNLQRLLDEIMDLAVALLKAEKGLILFRNEGTGDIELQVARAPDKSTIDNLVAMSRSTINRVVEKGTPIFLGRAPTAPDEVESGSLHRYQIKSVLCVPLKARDYLLGAIYLDTTKADHFFRQDDLFFLEAFANLAGIAIENARSYQEIENLNINLEKLVDERTQELQIKHKELKVAYEELKATQLQLIQSEKMASLGMLVAGIAHEVNTPLGTINSNTDMFLRSVQKMREGEGDPDKLLKAMEDIAGINQEACIRISGIVKTMKNFARLDEMEIKTVDIHEGIDSTLEILSHQHGNDVEIKKDFGEIPPLSCKASQVNQVFMHVLSNAIHALDKKGKITIRTYHADDITHVDISDTGKGIPPEQLKKIFDPGFTTKGVGVGIGLGLSIVYKIMEDHGGSVEVKSELGKGSLFSLKFPKDGLS